MKTIASGDKKVISIIKKKVDPDKHYRLSDFTYAFSEEGVHLLRNTLTGITAALSDTEWTFLESLWNQPVGKAEIANSGGLLITGSELIATGLSELVQNCFLVEEGSDDYKQYELVTTVLKTMSREKKGTKSYTILPTTGCNARCVYCYEEGMPVYSMSEETADRVVKFIDETRWQDKIKLIWFGGEPLIGSRIISRICNGLKEKNISFRSSIVTNATLFSSELLEEAVSLWNLETAQVSVDGKREDYEARKQYANPEVCDYDTMMRSVSLLLAAGIRVTLRCNYDGENLDGLEDFFDDVKERLGNSENLSVYPAMLFQTRSEGTSVALYRKAQELNSYLRDLGLTKKGKRDKPDESDDKPYKFKVNMCGADSGDKCVVIAPDGKLYHCEHLPGNTSFGSIYDPEISIHSDERANLPADDKCKTCCFLPECTPFFRNGCVDYFEQCREFKQIETEEALRRLIRKLSLS